MQPFQIRRGARTVLGDDLVTGAVKTQTRAERQVEIERQRARGCVTARGELAVLGFAEVRPELRRGRIRGIARAGTVVTLDERRVEIEYGQ